MRKVRGRGFGFAAAFAAAFGFCAAQASAACPGGTCHVTISGNNGAGSLREAVETLSVNGDAIVIDAPIDPSLNSQILIDKSITIQGAGAGTTEISNPATGPLSGRIFNIGSVTPGVVVAISELTIKDGDAIDGLPASSAAGQFGGGIRNAASLTLDGVTLSNNTAGDGGFPNPGGNGTGSNPGGPGGPGGLGGDGGAIYNTGTLTIANSTIAGNKAGKGGAGSDGGDGGATGDGGAGGAGGIGGFGGGILNLGSVSVTSSTFSNNQSGAGGAGGTGGDGGANFNNDGLGGIGAAGGSGGGIATGGPAAEISASTFSGNFTGIGGAGGGSSSGLGAAAGGAGGDGGGIGSSGAAITNVTLQGNIAGNGGNGGNNTGLGADGAIGFGGNGGGIGVAGAGTTVTNATLSGNKAGAKATVGSPFGVDGVGGGVVGPADLGNTILTINTVPPDNNSASTSNCAGTSDAGNNLAFPAAGSTGCPPSINGNPMLGGLAANGGPTLTMALTAASPAIDQIPLGSCPETDQRGFFRAPVAPCDIGAFERGAPDTLPLTPAVMTQAAVPDVAATGSTEAKKKCKKGRKLKRGKCVKKKKK